MIDVYDSRSSLSKYLKHKGVYMNLALAFTGSDPLLTYLGSLPFCIAWDILRWRQWAYQTLGGVSFSQTFQTTLFLEQAAHDALYTFITSIDSLDKL